MVLSRRRSCVIAITQRSMRSFASHNHAAPCISDAQAWLALPNLLLDADCRAKYRLDDFRTTALLGLRSALTQASTAKSPLALSDLAHDWQALCDWRTGLAPRARPCWLYWILRRHVPPCLTANL